MILLKVIYLVSSLRGQVTHFSLTPFPLAPSAQRDKSYSPAGTWPSCATV